MTILGPSVAVSRDCGPRAGPCVTLQGGQGATRGLAQPSNPLSDRTDKGEFYIVMQSNYLKSFTDLQIYRLSLQSFAASEKQDRVLELKKHRVI